MKKEILLRGLIGAPMGITIGFLITLFISIAIGNGTFEPVVPSLVQTMGSELNALILQTVLCALLGSGFAMASVIWEIESLSIAKQSGIYFAISCALMFPVAYFANWMEHTLIGALSYMLIFVAIFIVVWFVQYMVYRAQIKQINKGIKG